MNDKRYSFEGIRKRWYRNTCEYYFAYKGKRPIKSDIKTINHD